MGKNVNCMRLSNEDVTKLSDYRGSCLEIDVVYKTIEMLYKVVLFANHAFFSGDLQVAYQVLRDSALLFTRLDNKKAIAVVSNNLGNVMLTIYRTMRATGDEERYSLSKKEVIAKGTAYYTRSIKLGETAYDEFYNKQGWSEECLVFMQFLANRYFNRAIFFLTTSCDNDNREEAESLGFRDLQIAADMDIEIVDQCLEMGFKINRVERYEMMMSRVRGLIALAELGYSPDDLLIEDRIKEIYQDLKNAMKNPSHELFKDISVAGRMQKLDAELIKYFNQAKDDCTNAARVAIRMLVEDEYIFPDAEQEAMEVLLAFVTAAEGTQFSKDANCDVVNELESSINILERENVQRVQDWESHINSIGSTKSMRAVTTSISSDTGDKICITSLEGEELTREKVSRRLSLKESTREDITMELF